jgi:hypothetical protein
MVLILQHSNETPTTYTTHIENIPGRRNMRLAKQTVCACGEAVRTSVNGRANHAVAVVTP